MRLACFIALVPNSPKGWSASSLQLSESSYVWFYIDDVKVFIVLSRRNGEKYICSIFPKAEVVISFLTCKSVILWSLSLQIHSVDSTLVFSSWPSRYFKSIVEKSVFSKLIQDNTFKQLTIPIFSYMSGLPVCFHSAVYLCTHTIILGNCSI